MKSLIASGRLSRSFIISFSACRSKDGKVPSIVLSPLNTYAGMSASSGIKSKTLVYTTSDDTSQVQRQLHHDSQESLRKTWRYFKVPLRRWKIIAHLWKTPSLPVSFSFPSKYHPEEDPLSNFLRKFWVLMSLLPLLTMFPMFLFFT